MGSWREGSWGNDRGPDPVLEHKAFVSNILDNLSRPVFDKELCEVMLEQKWFNGIGNYLRAEVMYRAGLSPFTKARTVFAKTPKNFDFSKINASSDVGLIVLYLCRQIPLEVITQGAQPPSSNLRVRSRNRSFSDMNKYGSEDQKKRFHDWLRIYDKGTQVKKNGRAVHYAASQMMTGVLKPDLGTPIVDSSGATVPLAAAPAPAAESPKQPTFSAPVSAKTHSGMSTAQVTQMLPLVIGNKPTPAVFAAALQSGSARDVSPLSVADDTTIPPEAKILVLLAQARRSARISPEEHRKIKIRLLLDDAAIYSALEVYETDQDFEDFLDTAKRLAAAALATLPPRSTPLASVSVTASAPTSFATAAQTMPAPSAASASSLSGILTHLVEPSWISALSSEFKQPYWQKLNSFVEGEYKKFKNSTFPPQDVIFNAFNSCPLQNIKAVILGQDPYFNQGQAHGLCFSVQHGVTPPPSLVNIYKELETDIAGFRRPDHGNLQKWANQGVFLLNAILTVKEKAPMSHSKQGWEQFTTRVIEVINDQCDGVVFLLWGLPAQNKAGNINKAKHLVLKASHPSPMSAHNGWFGQKHFSKANAFLESKGKTPVQWQL